MKKILVAAVANAVSIATAFLLRQAFPGILSDIAMAATIGWAIRSSTLAFGQASGYMFVILVHGLAMIVSWSRFSWVFGYLQVLHGR